MENNLSNNTTKKTIDYANTFTKFLVNPRLKMISIYNPIWKESVKF